MLGEATTQWFAAAIFAASGLHAQSDRPLPSGRGSIRGVALARGVPLGGVNVFDLETLEGAFTNADGRFTIALADSNRHNVRLAARHLGYRPIEIVVVDPGDSVVISMEPMTALAAIGVIAGRYTAEAGATATLTPLEVMTTPGGGDVNSTVKTLPGVQNVDEGSGLFVRGGDYTETRTFIDGAPMFTPYQIETPTGSVAGTINPFLTDGIAFSAGGFGAQRGNALSGVVELQPQGVPQSTSLSMNATLLSAGAGASLRVGQRLGFSATAGFNDLSALFAINGNPRAYEPAPHGNSLSGQGVWQYSRTGRVTLFALRQRTALGIEVVDPSATMLYRSNRRSDVAVLSLRDTLGKWQPFLALSTSGISRDDDRGAYDGASTLRSWQARGQTAYAWSERVVGLVGGESERISAVFDTRFPLFGYDQLPNAPSGRAMLDRVATRNAVYAQLDTRPFSSAEMILGARSDHSGYATSATVDPRISAAWRPTSALSLTANWGTYHQVADPLFLEGATSDVVLPSIHADMTIVGMQIGEGKRFARVEAWNKRYGDLVALTREYTTASDLSGRARGIDIFARSDGPLGTRLRLTWSMARSRRTDPDSRLDAPAPFDITNSVTAVVERDWSNGWHVGVAHRFATGKPFTDVAGATYDSTRRVFAPVYDAPNAARLPDYRRADIAVSRARVLSGGRFLAVFGAIQNPFNTVNLFGYTWTRDYATRVPVRSAINRTLFVGANLVLSKNQ